VAGGNQEPHPREARFRDLYQANYRLLQAYAVNRMGPSDEVADVVAEVFLTAWRRLDAIPTPPGDRFWLYRTAWRVISRRHRGARRRSSLVSRLAAEQHHQMPFIQALPGAPDPARDRLLAAVAQLNPAHREALLLVHWEQLSYAEAARTAGCSVNAVGLRVHKAKARLRELLADGAQPTQPEPADLRPNGVTDGS
jgi:RNA polymerase sigma-70 factor, ECF subfamily